ncbi:SMP-30/gluconolactonase/LRE family protein [Methylotenera sp.]|uniref:SMP-30/gluconolactonase/LRE family protein n=1 Tax=Methylotenera sp. TaxID=2051956 RepID=UPI0027203166|nr:SMP-30/gluconolactonase/LRE family protein [Methylotenera sp.]MDO9205948.1 SMP-30/gluconolactonase/LRE family protein [Methylotenera sp.]MDO9392729.1 SMP-30/gluconolactonase/LRE family protein [Methylotenera sp.]MDP2071061.1 SMP-30/gluconolactonase/LRE family protein [Methylotenera sp.]MDP3005935.1 SMP-30/gluconolactonase/LRE family protein [Methylotenera sp.]MDP3817788.1 SMP-30/gluconolactonase/LRE family protein [Methylotenera sp.]
MQKNFLDKKLLASALMLALLGAGCATEVKTNQGDMQKITGLKTPESVVQANNGKIYVSEINEFGKDGDGQITVIEDGKQRVFATGLDDPKGLAIIGQTLYVADKTKILKIDVNGNVKVFVPASEFPVTPLFLNDLEADPQGNLYVSDSGDLFNTNKGGAVYKINSQGKVQLLINDTQDARIKAPNGLLADNTGHVLIILDFASGVLYSLNTQTNKLTDIAEGFGGGDGVVHHSNGTMYVSDWKNGKVFSVNTKGDVAVLKSGYQSAADIAITKNEKYIMVPDMKAGELDFVPVQ